MEDVVARCQEVRAVGVSGGDIRATSAIYRVDRCAVGGVCKWPVLDP